MAEWQPIETAPTDGTLIDVWVQPVDRSYPGRRIADTSWESERGRWHSMYFCPLDHEITHWASRPEPPK